MWEYVGHCQVSGEEQCWIGLQELCLVFLKCCGDRNLVWLDDWCCQLLERCLGVGEVVTGVGFYSRVLCCEGRVWLLEK